MQLLFRCLLLFFGTFHTLAAQSIEKNWLAMPSYTQVLDSLLEQYDPDLAGDDYLAISRQPTGYYVGVAQQEAVYPSQTYAYWLQGDKRPRSLPFPKKQAASMPHYSTEAVGVWRIEQFDRHLYYGYADFTRDAIEQLEALSTLSQQERLWLARAHEEHAANLLNNQYGTAAPKYRFLLAENSGQKLSEQQLNTYLNHLETAVAQYAALEPSTPTPVGDPNTKANHLLYNAYLSLLQYASPQDAKAVLQKVGKGYDAHLSFCAKLLLESCPQNAILITEGDNDTYPLLHEQLVHGHRTDVLVVNRHLLHFPRYMQVLRQGQQVGGSLNLSSSAEEIFNWQQAIYLPGPREVIYDVAQVLAILPQLAALPTSEQAPIARLPFGALRLSEQIDGPLFRPEAPVFQAAELSMLDLIASNWKKRPIAVAATIDQAYFAYSNSWQQIGLAYSLGDEKSAYGIDLPGTLAWSQLLKRSKPIDTLGIQSLFYLDYLEKLVLATSRHLRAIREEAVAVELIDRYLSHLQRDRIFRRLGSEKLLRQMSELGYDPVRLSAYASMLKQTLEAEQVEEVDTYRKYTIEALNYFLQNGNFPPQGLF